MSEHEHKTRAAAIAVVAAELRKDKHNLIWGDTQIELADAAAATTLVATVIVDALIDLGYMKLKGD